MTTLQQQFKNDLKSVIKPPCICVRFEKIADGIIEGYCCIDCGRWLEDIEDKRLLGDTILPVDDPIEEW